MSTPRKHWFRVADSIAREAWSNDVLATVVRLMGSLNNQWARDGLTADEAGRIELRPGDLLAITGSNDARTAQRRIHQAAIAVHAECNFIANPLDTRRKICRLHWPKWSEFQGLDAREQGKPGTSRGSKTPPPPPPPQDAPAPATKRDPGTASRPVSRSTPSAKSLCPERLNDEQRTALVRWANAKGFTESECRWAFNAVKDWSHGGGQRRADWVATTRNAMRDGWGLKGYRETDAERYEREMAESPFRVVKGGSDGAA